MSCDDWMESGRYLEKQQGGCSITKHIVECNDVVLYQSHVDVLTHTVSPEGAVNVIEPLHVFKKLFRDAIGRRVSVVVVF